MMNMLAQSTLEHVGLGAGGATVLGVLALLIKRGVKGNFNIGGSGKDEGPYMTEKMCLLRHQEQDKRDIERAQRLHDQLKEIKDQAHLAAERNERLQEQIQEIKVDIKAILLHQEE